MIERAVIFEPNNASWMIMSRQVEEGSMIPCSEWNLQRGTFTSKAEAETLIGMTGGPLARPVHSYVKRDPYGVVESVHVLS